MPRYAVQLRIRCVGHESRRTRCAVFAAGLGRMRQFFAGTRGALVGTMRSDETWTIPLHIIMWTTIIVGLIMAMAVVMLH